MAPSSKMVAAFFDPGAPPLPLPLLTSQTDLFYNVNHLPTIVAHEELVAMHHYKPLSPVLDHLPTAEQRIENEKKNYVKSNARTLQTHAIGGGGNDGDDDDRHSSSTSDVKSDSSDDSDEGKIAKPAGEPGRPGRGGYNLEVAVNWEASAFSRLKKCVYHLVENHLDTTKSYANQRINLLRIVCMAALEDFPELVNYHGCWPVMDLVKMCLKYTSVCSR
ncbi:hypothetical protein K439DRAFT_1611073 [Ramaria rubella]|nr:hypothetical protein K439DRAFT_1611073 [Ramaria rubella]